MKFLARMVIGCLFVAGPVTADMLGVRAGLEYWQAKPEVVAGNTGAAGRWSLQDANGLAWAARFEHPIPLLPNFAARYQHNDYSAQAPLLDSLQLGQTVYSAGQNIRQYQKYQHYDVTAYYELIDNPLLSIDLGLTVRQLKVKSELNSNSINNTADLSVLLPMLYLDTEIGVWGTDTVVFAKGNYSRYQSDLTYDWQAGIAWRLIDVAMFQGYLRAGWQYNKQDISDRDHLDVQASSSGGFVGLYLDF
jgi:outer membrane protein